MVSSWGPAIEFETAFCVAGWAVLVYKNIINRLFIFAVGCLLSTAAYVLAFWQYYLFFWSYQINVPDASNNMLFLRMLFHCVALMVFIGWYNCLPRRRTLL